MLTTTQEDARRTVPITSQPMLKHMQITQPLLAWHNVPLYQNIMLISQLELVYVYLSVQIILALEFTLITHQEFVR